MAGRSSTRVHYSLIIHLLASSRPDFLLPGSPSATPVVAASELVGRLRASVAELAREEHLVATVTESLIGNTVNVIPTEGRLRGTMRALSTDQRAALHTELKHLALATAAEVGVEARYRSPRATRPWSTTRVTSTGSGPRSGVTPRSWR
jgi:metal-dependent amidase/aminoacylase/carboxypeptidase family protein